MTLAVIPSRVAIRALAAIGAIALVALIARLPVDRVGWTVSAAVVALAAAAIVDYLSSRRAWRQSPPAMTRILPAAFAIGVKRPVQLAIATSSGRSWECELFDHADASLVTEGLPMRLSLSAGTQVDTTYTATPTFRGEVSFKPADVRVRSRWGLCEMLEKLGAVDMRRVYPDFAQVARYAWLAGDHRLQEIGIKTFHQRGQGTDFKQLAEYRIGDPVRHIDWRATLRHTRPIVRQFQEERDQCVMLLVDCGRRMRAHDMGEAAGTTHFDQVLNAVMLMTYVALQEGDAVGAMTFGTPEGEGRSFPPRKGVHALNGLMSELFGVQPTLTHSDYVAAAQELLRRQHRRALVIVLTNFRDEDASELGQALRLLRSRHLVLVASLRERVLGELIAQPLVSGDAAVDIASAQLYEQARRDAFNRLADRDALMVDAEPEHLGIALVNRYHAMKRAGKI